MDAVLPQHKMKFCLYIVKNVNSLFLSQGDPLNVHAAPKFLMLLAIGIAQELSNTKQRRCQWWLLLLSATGPLHKGAATHA